MAIFRNHCAFLDLAKNFSFQDNFLRFSASKYDRSLRKRERIAKVSNPWNKYKE